jgi:hypothetical protein
LVISPDNECRGKLNSLIHREMQNRGDVSKDEHKLRVLESRHEMTGADRQWAGQYEVGDVVRYSRRSKALKIEAGEYARVSDVDPKENRITIEREKGTLQTYDPRPLRSVGPSREHEFSEGDRIQFTAPSKEQKVANRELGTIERVSSGGDLRIRLDLKREVQFNIREHAHLDHGYAVTSHSSQGQTAERVLIHVDTDKSELLVNNRFAYSIPKSRLFREEFPRIIMFMNASQAAAILFWLAVPVLVASPNPKKANVVAPLTAQPSELDRLRQQELAEEITKLQLENKALSQPPPSQANQSIPIWVACIAAFVALLGPQIVLVMQARADRRKEMRLALAQFGGTCAAAIHHIQWLTWKPAQNLSLTTADFDAYDNAMDLLFPQLTGSFLTASALNPSFSTQIKTLHDEIIDTDSKIGQLTAKARRTNNEDRDKLMEFHHAVNKLWDALPEGFSTLNPSFFAQIKMVHDEIIDTDSKIGQLTAKARSTGSPNNEDRDKLTEFHLAVNKLWGALPVQFQAFMK